jgi:hypothetical protein
VTRILNTRVEVVRRLYDAFTDGMVFSLMAAREEWGEEAPTPDEELDAMGRLAIATLNMLRASGYTIITPDEVYSAVEEDDE